MLCAYRNESTEPVMSSNTIGQGVDVDANKDNLSVILAIKPGNEPQLNAEESKDTFNILEQPRLFVSNSSSLDDSCSICLQPFASKFDCHIHQTWKGLNGLQPSTAQVSSHLASMKDQSDLAAGTAPVPSVLTPCKHRFHVPCITEAMTRPLSCGQPAVCPLCRSPLVPHLSATAQCCTNTDGAEPAWSAVVVAARVSAARRFAGTAPPSWWRACCLRHRLVIVAAIFAVYVTILVSLLLKFD